MDESQLKFDGSAGGGGAGADLQNELPALRTLIAAVLVLLIIFTASVDYYLSGQTTEMRRAMAAEQAEVDGFPAFVSKATEFWNKLLEYSKSHPDFVPVIDKWKANFTVTPSPPPKKK